MPKNKNEMSPDEARSIMNNPSYALGLALFGNELVLNGAQKVRAQIAELKIFDPISDGYMGQFTQFDREKGELFIPVRRGWPQFNVVTDSNPEKPSVVQINTLFIGDEQVSCGSLLKKLFPSDDFDGYDLARSTNRSELYLSPQSIVPSVEILRDDLRKALAVLHRV